MASERSHRLPTESNWSSILGARFEVGAAKRAAGAKAKRREIVFVKSMTVFVCR